MTELLEPTAKQSKVVVKKPLPTAKPVVAKPVVAKPVVAKPMADKLVVNVAAPKTAAPKTAVPKTKATLVDIVIDTDESNCFVKGYN